MNVSSPDELLARAGRPREAGCPIRDGNPHFASGLLTVVTSGDALVMADAADAVSACTDRIIGREMALRVLV